LNRSWKKKYMPIVSMNNSINNDSYMAKISKYSIITKLTLLCLFFSCTKDGAYSSANGAGGSLARYTISGNYLYIVDNQQLNVFDISDPGNPAFRTSQQIGFEIETIYPHKDKLFIGSANGLYVYSLSNPESPVQEGAITHVRACDPVVANDSVAYVTLRTGVTCGGYQNILNIYNVSNPNYPSLVRTVDLKSPYGLAYSQNALFVCEGENGMVVFSLADPYNPKRLKELRNEFYYDVIPYNEMLICFVSHGILLYDISEPLVPVLLSGILR